ncbi:MAG: DUF2786 domain-containing protein [bacterium]
MSHTSTELLERRLLLGLDREWDLATAWLPQPIKTRLRPPLFAIHDLGACWGRWTGGHWREMAFSRDLVLNHSWDAVVEVLRHELAHQLADEMEGAGDEPPHGPAFLRMCTLTGANPRASIGFSPLDTRLFTDAEPPAADHLLLRVRKLLALAGSPNSHEAELAMRKAHELMARYNLDLLGRDAPREYLSVFLGQSALRHPRAAHLLANLLQEYYFVRTIWASSYILEKERMGRVLEISGTLANVRVAHYVHDFVSRCMAAEWERYRPAGHPRSREDHAAFAVGLLTGFAEKLCAQRAVGLSTTPAKALLKLKDARLDAYFARRYPAVNKGRTNGWAPDATVFEHGRSRGRALVIHRGVTAASSRSQDRRLLPPVVAADLNHK